MNRFWMLLKKDWRVNLAPIFGLLIITVAPYLIALVAHAANAEQPQTRLETWYDAQHHMHAKSIQIYEGAPLIQDLQSASIFSALFITVMASAFGGIAFAQERRDHSADFLAMLPVKRLDIISSKLLVALGLLLLAGAIDFLGLVLTNYPDDWLLRSTLNPVSCGLAMFSIAWVLSTFLESAAIAASIAIVVVIGAIAITWTFSPYPQSLDNGSCAAAGFIVAIIFTLAGSIYYARRIAP